MMRRKGSFVRASLHGLVTLLLLVVAPGALASVEFLLQQAHPDGSIATSADVANPNQSTAEAAAALRLMGVTTQVDAAESFVRAQAYRGSEELSRLIYISVARGESAGALATELLAHQNPDGGFGELPGFDSTPLDTGFALDALYRAGQRQTNANLAALNYLMQSQNAAGGWAMGENVPSAYVTAQAMQAIWQFRQLLPTSVPSAQRARDYLLALRGSTGLWESNFVSAVALRALAPMQQSQGELASSVAALTALRAANGSWDNDVYVTALAMQGTLLASGASANPDLARLRGRLVDGETLAALGGANVRLTGAGSVQRTSNSSGDFDFTDLAAGSYSLSVEPAGYPPVTAALTLRAGQTLDLGVLRLLRNAVPTVARVEGVVRNEAGLPLAGVNIFVTGATSVQTDAAGLFLLNDVPPGNVTMTATLNGYFSAQGSTVLVAGATVNFSPVMRAVKSTGFSVVGTFRDSATQALLAGVSVTISGSASASTTSNASGVISLANLAPGVVNVVISRAGYVTRTAMIEVSGGQQLDVSAGLDPVVAGAPETFGISGRVTDRVTGLPLAGASVTITTPDLSSVQTDADGRYAFANLQPGSFSINIFATGYQAAAAADTGVAFQSIDFSPALLPTDTRPTGLHALVVDGTNGNPIEGASVVITNSEGSVTVTTVPGGEFIARNLADGPTSVSVIFAGYQSSQLSLSTVSGFINDLGSISLLPQTYDAPIALSGRVVRSTTGAALAGVSIVVTTSTGTQATQSDGNGRFSVTVPAGETADLEFVATDFVTTRFSLPTSATDTDLGQVRLRPQGLDSLLADLATLSVDASLAVSTSDTYQVSGSVSARLQNRGFVAAPAATAVIAFEDRNTNGTLDAGEPQLGRTTLVTDLAPGEIRNVTLAVAGTASFRDAPITVLADPDLEVVERDETNNARASVGACVALPPAASALAPKLKWRWSGSPARPTDNSVFGPVMVGQFTDDNGDGRIDSRDVPDLVFTTRQQSLTVISGDDGHTIWQTPVNTVTGYGSVAIADIDGDGLNEIVVSNALRTALLAFENDGTLKWSAPNGPQHGDMTRDGITIANIDGVGLPEIITGRRVYNANGTLRWEGDGDYGGTISYGTLPIAADIDGDGKLEVIAGRSAYKDNGAGGFTRLWQANASGDGWTAIGNFDADPQPEIVLVTGGQLYLLENNGAIKWGPVAIPGGSGRGGAPTVGDFDGDGQPEIGVAGASAYTVFETDGSIKWSRPTQDASSAVTGSSLFDFDGDGRTEVVYADELRMFIFDGATGTQLQLIPNLSGTTLEYPVIADVDGDGRAEIVVAANDGSEQGVRVFEGSQGEWMPTRPIWNQSTYHIDNINDDGTVPAVEAKGWLTHNSYRANAAIQRQAEPVADLTAGALTLLDNGIGQPSSLRLRVGNAGAPLASGIATVNFYDGSPTAGGRLLGSTAIPGLASGTFADVQLDGITTVSPNGTLFAVVDPTSRVTECNEQNNTASTLGRPAIGALAINTNLPQYAPGATVQIQSSITNTGLFTNSYHADLGVFDTAGNAITTLGSFSASNLASGASLPNAGTFSSTGLLDGIYVIRGSLFDSNNVLLTTTDRLFAIGHDATQGAAATLRVETDRATYHTSDAVTMNSLARNLTTGLPFLATRVHLVVTSPAGVAVFDQSVSLGDLMPSASRDAQQVLRLNAAAEGNYSVAGTLESGTGQALATGSDTFEVRGNLAVSLSGTVTLAARSVAAGEALLCTRTTRNGGTTDLTNLSLRYVVARLADGVSVSDQQVNATIAAGGSNSSVSSINTAGFTGGDYVCALQARVNDSWRDLAYGVFTVTAPSVRIDASLAVGTRGKLLALVDGEDGWPCTQMKDIEMWAPFPTHLDANAQVLVELFDSAGTRLDRETVKLSSYRGTVNANRVNASDLRITGLSADVLTVQLASNSSLGSGWQLVATVTMDGLPPIVLESNDMGESCGWRVGTGAKLGDFEVSGGTGIGCNELPGHVPSNPSLTAQRAFLEQLLTDAGWSYKIVTSAADFTREMRTGAYAHYALFSENEKISEQGQHELREAVFAGATLLDAGSHDHRHHAFDEALGIKPNGKRPNATAVTFTAPWMTPGTASIVRTQFPLRVTLAGATSIGSYNVSPSQGPVAITEYTYGRGESSYVGYDLLAEATYAGATSLHASFLRKVLDELKSQRPPPRAGEVVPLELTITNRAGATPGRATLALPAGVQLIDAGGATVQSGVLTWDFSLAVDEVKKRIALVRLPATAGTVNFEAVVSSGTSPGLVEQARPKLNLSVAARASSQDAVALASAYPGTFKNVTQWLQQAANFAAAGKQSNALSSLVKAADELTCVYHPQTNNLRWMVDDLIWNTSRLVP